MEQSSSLGHGKERPHAHGARGFTKDCHVVRIASEVGDVLSHPAQRPHGVLNAEGSRTSQLGTDDVTEVREAQHPQAIVETHHDEVVVHGEPLTVVPGRRARSGDERAAVNPHHHRTLGAVAVGCPDIESQTLGLTGDDWCALGQEVLHRREGLGRVRSVRVRRERSAVCQRRFGSSKTKRAHRCLGVGYSEKSLVAR